MMTIFNLYRIPSHNQSKLLSELVKRALDYKVDINSIIVINGSKIYGTDAQTLYRSDLKRYYGRYM